MTIFAEKIDIIYFYMTGKEFARKVFSPIVGFNLLGMILLIVLVCLGTSWWMKSYTRHGEGIDVPDVRGLLVADASIELTKLELDCIVIDSSYDAKLAPGIVLEQTPGAGSRIKAGREIYVTINAKTEPTLPVPNIIDNCSLREAEAKLQSLGFKLGPCEYVEGQKDWVLGIKCKGRNVSIGERIPINSPVVLVVGNNQIEFDENEQSYGEEWVNTNEEGLTPVATGEDEEMVF